MARVRGLVRIRRMGTPTSRLDLIDYPHSVTPRRRPTRGGEASRGPLQNRGVARALVASPDPDAEGNPVRCRGAQPCIIAPRGDDPPARRGGLYVPAAGVP